MKLLKLAENPLTLSEDEDSMDYSEEAEDSMDDELDKGKKVSGPRTKLSNSNDLATLANTVGNLAKGVRAIAQSQAVILKHMEMADPAMGGGMPPQKPQMPPQDDFGGGADPMGGGGDDFGAEDELGGPDDLDLDMMGGNFNPYGDEMEDPMRGGDVTQQVAYPYGMAKAIAGAVIAALKKDDSSSNFGEKDSDIVGNRPLNPDDKDKSADQVLIQGGSGAGPGPVSKAFVNAVTKAVAAELAKTSKVSRSTTSPRIDDSTSQIAKAVDTSTEDVDSMIKKAASTLSFQDIARWRIQEGDLSAGIL